MLEKTCRCKKEYSNKRINTNVRGPKTPLLYVEGREYQVDVFPLFNVVYNNGGWTDYCYLNNEEFDKYFELIK